MMGDSNEVSSKVVFYLFLLVTCMRIMCMRGSSGFALKGLPVIDAVWRERFSSCWCLQRSEVYTHMTWCALTHQH